MKIVFMGTPEFALAALKKLAALSLIHISEPTRH